MMEKTGVTQKVSTKNLTTSQNNFNKVFRTKKPAKENLKSEYRNPKQYQSSNS